MRHRNLRRRLGVKSAHRTALLRNLVRSLVISKRIETTVAKAKEASAFSDSAIELAKKNTLHARRLLVSRVGCAETADALIKEIAPQFKDRHGGYTRVLKLGNRSGDGAQKAILEFTVPFETLSDKREKAAAARAKKKGAKAVKAKEVEQPAEETKPKKKGRTKKEKVEEAQVQEGEKLTSEEKKESEKKGFLGTLRKFLKGDE